MPQPKPKTIDDYIATTPPDIQPILQQLRQIIHTAAPDAQETISYNMPAFKQNGIIIWFAASKNHIGLYPKATGIQAFKDQLTDYQTSKGTIRIPLDKPLPVGLIKKIVAHNLQENLAKH